MWLRIRISASLYDVYNPLLTRGFRLCDGININNFRLALKELLIFLNKKKVKL